MIKQVTNDNELNTELEKAGNKLVIVDFFATWCGPCKRINPVLEKLSEQYPNVVFLKADVDENLESSTRYQITSMPTFLFIKKKEILERFSGALKDRIVSNICKFTN